MTSAPPTVSAAQARQPHALLAKIVQASSHAIVSLDDDGLVTSWNAAAERLLGVAAADIVGAPFDVAPAIAAHPEIRAALGHLPPEGERFDISVRDADGGEMLVLVILAPLVDENGVRLGLSLTARDITAQDLAERSRAHLAAIVANSDDAIGSKTLDGVVTSWNAAAERMFGYSAAEMIGASMRKLIPAERQAEEDEILRRLAAGERVSFFDTVRLRKDGERLEVSLTVSPILDARGRVIGASNIIRDISERRRAERQIEALTQEVAHRAKNLLSVVQAIVRQTASVGAPETLAERLQERFAALAKTQNLVQAEDGARADLAQLIAGQLAHFQDLIGTRITLDGPPLTVNAQAAQNIGMAIHELATNASKYGALSADGLIDIVWSAGEAFHLEWRESGGPAVTPPTRQGFGWRVTDRLAGASVGGQGRTRYEPTGVVWTLSAPLGAVVAEDGA